MGKIYFISDLHLGAGTMDKPLDYERRVVRFLDSIIDDCDELYLLGDIIDYWFEYKHVVPRGFTRFLGKIGEMTDRGIKVHWFTGNHDIWIYPAGDRCHCASRAFADRDSRQEVLSRTWRWHRRGY